MAFGNTATRNYRYRYIQPSSWSKARTFNYRGPHCKSWRRYWSVLRRRPLRTPSRLPHWLHKRSYLWRWWNGKQEMYSIDKAGVEWRRGRGCSGQDIYLGSWEFARGIYSSRSGRSSRITYTLVHAKKIAAFERIPRIQRGTIFFNRPRPSLLYLHIPREVYMHIYVYIYKYE